MVFVSPLKASLQTCMDIYPKLDIPVIVEPLIAPRINAASSISHNTTETLKQMQGNIDSKKVD